MWNQIRRNYRRLIAFMLTVAMVSTNVGGNLSTVFAAGESENALFLVDGGELRKAIREAEEEGEVFKLSSLQLAAARKSIKNKYEKLLGTKEGKVYELDLDIDGSYAPEGTSVQVFYNAGTKDVIFLFENESEMVVDYRVNIDGYETKGVTVNPNTKNIEDEDAAYAENYEAADMINDVADQPKAEEVAPKDEETAEAGEGGETTADGSQEGTEGAEDANRPENEADEVGSGSGAGGSEEENTADGTEEPGTEGDGAETDDAGLDEPEATKAEPEATETEAEDETEPEAEPETESEAEPETEAEAEFETESEAEAEGADSAEGELLSMSRHEAAVVAVSLDDLAEGDGSALTEAEPIDEVQEEAETEVETEEESEAETEAETREERETEPERETKEASEAETESGSEAETEGNGTGDGAAAEETDGSGNESKEPEAGDIDASEGADGSGESSAAGETPAAAEGDSDGPEEPDGSIADESEASGSVAGNGNGDGTDEIEMEGQALEGDEIELLGALEGKAFDTVTILDNINARAVKVAWEDIEEIISTQGLVDDAEGYHIDYVVSLPEAARVKGADTVAEGEDLYFAVEPEPGYEIINVTANGEALEEAGDTAYLASASEWKGYPHLYVAEAVAEDLLIEVELEELDPIIPDTVYNATVDNAVFTVNAPDGAFEEAVALQVVKITEEEAVQELTDQAKAALKEGQIVAGVLAYDVAFISQETGNEVEPMQAVEVNIRYKEAVVPQEIDEQGLTGISVVHLPEKEAAEVVASVEDTKETEFVFRADSFSPVLVVFGAAGGVEVDGTPYASLSQAFGALDGNGDETIRLLADVEIQRITFAGKSFTLDLNGKTIYATDETYKGIHISGEGARVVITSSAEGGAVSAKGDKAKGGIQVYKGATLVLQGGSIINGTDSYGGGVYVYQGAVFQMEGGAIEENSAEKNGGGVYAAGKFIMNGGRVSKNTCAYYGGGVYVVTTASFTMSDGVIGNNINTSYYGGGVYNSGNFVMEAGSIEGNVVRGYGYSNGGGVYNAGTFTMSGGCIERNSIRQSSSMVKGYGNGGGIYHAGGKMEIKDAAIAENVGGGVHINGGDTHFENVMIVRNTGNRPALYIDGDGQFSATHCTINENVVGENIVSVAGGSEANVRTFEECTISNNESTGMSYSNGNIIILKSSANVSFVNCRISENATKADGGAATVYCEVASLSMRDTQIEGNKSQGTGGVGGIRQSSGSSKITLENTVITGNIADGSDTSCGGVCVTTGKFVLNSGAVYNNTSGNELGDFRFTKDAEWELMKASKMQDTILMPENYFEENNYEWLGGTAEGMDRVSFSTQITSKDNNIKELQGRNDLFIQAVSTKHLPGVYIGDKGDDANDGLSADQAVKTFGRAMEVLGKFNEGKEEEEKTNILYVTGTISIEEDTEWDGQGVILERDLSGPFTGVMVSVKKGATLKLKNIVLDGGALKGVQSYGLVKVTKKGSLEINEGAVLQNSSKSLGNQLEGGGGVYLNEGTAVLNKGGKIMNNSAHNGGGVSLMTGSHFIMNGGEISGNTTERSGDFGRKGYYTSGGGVFIAYDGKMEMHGGTISGNTSFDGGGISLGGPENDVFFKNNHPEFTMYGGAIDSNESYSNGGGMFVQMNCTATIYGGSITNNHTRALLSGANFGGGGVYVNGGKSERLENGLLWLYNVEIAKNQADRAKGNGAALAGCPTSRTKIYLTDGGVIHGNGGDNDLYLMSGNLAGNYSGTAQLVISPFMLGGGAYHWTDAEGNELPLNGGFVQVFGKTFYAKTGIADDAVTGLDQVKTYITGNTSGSSSGPGAAIGSNGDVIIGSAPKEVVELTIEKAWNDSGYEENRPKEVDIRILQSKDGENFVDIGFVKLSEENGWKATVKDLPKQDQEGNDFIYHVSEVPNGYSAEVTKNSGDNFFTFVVTNTPSSNLTLKKVVSGQAADKEFTFKISLSLADGSPFSGQADMVKPDGSRGKLTFENGEAIITLKKDEAIQLENLPQGMAYKIEEIDKGGANGTSIAIDGNSVSEAAGTIQLGGNINVVVFTNTFDEPENPPYNPPGGGGGGGGGGGSTPPRTTTIVTPEVPLANFPEPVTELIEEEEVPLMALPKTGDARHAGLLLALFGIAGIGAFFSAAGLRKNKEED